MNLNFFSTFTLCKLCLPHLRETKGNIINMSSLVGIQGQRFATTYCATKGALTAFSKSLAIEEADHGVRINIVSPGNIWTPLWRVSYCFLALSATVLRCIVYINFSFFSFLFKILILKITYHHVFILLPFLQLA